MLIMRQREATAVQEALESETDFMEDVVMPGPILTQHLCQTLV